MRGGGGGGGGPGGGGGGGGGGGIQPVAAGGLSCRGHKEWKALSKSSLKTGVGRLSGRQPAPAPSPELSITLAWDGGWRELTKPAACFYRPP